MGEAMTKEELTERGGKSSIVLAIEAARKAGMNMLLPSTHVEGLSEFHTPVIDYIDLNPAPAAGDVYFHTESGKLALTKHALIKIALCAGIIWNSEETKRVDDRSDRNYVSYRAVGGITMADGAIVWAPPGEYDMDFDVIEEELRELYSKKGRKDKKTAEALDEYIEYCVKRDLLHKRKHKIKLAEAGAMNRVVRMLLGLKPGYTKEELKRPFVVVRIIFSPDYSDPEIRGMVLEKGLKSMTSVYGGVQRFDEHERPTTQQRDLTPTNKTPDNDSKEPSDNDDELTNEKADFCASDKSSQIDTLKKLAKRKGYDLKQLKRPLSQWVDSEYEGFFDKLAEMPDLNKKDDCPF